MARNVVLGALVMLGWCATSLRADDQVLAELYGRGVHSFYAERYEDAQGFLTQAIDKGTQDPRCYYFRGLTYALTGRDEEASEDFKKGAELEAAATEQLFNVSRALQRVQGEVRLEIEKHRQSARIAARDLAAQRARARYEEFLQNEREGLLNPGAAPPVPRPATPPPPDSAPLNDPFGNAAPVPSAPAGDAAPPTATNPTTPPATTPDAADPFGTPPATTPPATTPPAADPFGAPVPSNPATTNPAASDPFGAPATGAPAATAPANAGANGDKRGALRGLFRAFRSTIPAPTVPGLPGGGGDPFGAPPGGDPFGAPPGGDPFGAPPGNDPFGAPPAGNDPFGAPPAGNDPFGAPPAGNDSDDSELNAAVDEIP